MKRIVDTAWIPREVRYNYHLCKERLLLKLRPDEVVFDYLGHFLGTAKSHRVGMTRKEWDQRNRREFHLECDCDAFKTTTIGALLGDKPQPKPVGVVKVYRDGTREVVKLVR